MARKKRENPLVYIVFFILGIVLTSLVYYSQIVPRINSMITSSRENANSQFSSHIIERSMPIVAVNENEDTGYLGNLTVRLIPGESNVLIDTNPFLETDLQYSANLAVAIAKIKAQNSADNTDFVITYNIEAQVVGGGSAGAATALTVLAALKNRTINPAVAITGTINRDGSIGQVGGILEKAKAVADAGYKTFLIPKGQSKIKYYEKVVQKEQSIRGFMLYNTQYVPRVVDIKDAAKNDWNLTIIEVINIDQAEKYMFN